MWLTNVEGVTRGGSCHDLALSRLGQKDHEFEAGLDYKERPCLKRWRRRKRREKCNAVLVTFPSL